MSRARGRLLRREALPGGMSERDFQTEVIDLLHLYRWRVAHFEGVNVLRPDGRRYYATPAKADGKGWPDLVAVKPPRLLIAELKRDGQYPTPDQREWLADLEAVGRAMLTPGGVAVPEVYVWRPKDWPRIQLVIAGRAPAGR